MTDTNHIPTLEPRVPDPSVEKRALEVELSPLQSRLLANRLQGYVGEIDSLAYPSLRHIPHPNQLTDGRRAAERIAKAVTDNEPIGILTDYDVDGITSHTVIKRTLNELFGVPEERLYSLIGHRINDGYGISQSLVERTLALSPRPGIVVTADCGSSDEPRIALLKEAGIDVIVSDHHVLPEEGHPTSAYATVNPSRVDCGYPDSTIAGCMVAWLLMSLTRDVLIGKSLLATNDANLVPYLSYVALGTVADCVALGTSPTNRAVINQGLKLINRFDTPCWRAIAKLLGDNSVPFNAETLGFQLGPRINARSRLNDPYAALYYMLAEDDATAMQHLLTLDEDNQSRKAIEAAMTEEGKRLAISQLEAGHPILTILLKEGHQGVQGIVASRLVQAYGRPTIVLTPAAQEGLLSGSGRSVEGLNIRDALQSVSDQAPDCLPRFGGHTGAAGVTVLAGQFDTFQKLLVDAVSAQLGDTVLRPRIFTDGALAASQLTLDTLDEVETLGPFGREFEAPLFQGIFEVESFKVIGVDKTHLTITLNTGQESIRCVWFNSVPSGGTPPFNVGAKLNCAYRLNRNKFRGNETLQLMIAHAERVT